MQQKGYIVIKASTYDNPFLPPEYIPNILNNYDPILADLYLRGEIVSLNQNKVYHFYDRIKHYTDKTIKDFKELHIGYDMNIGGCCASVFGIQENKAYMVDEFVSHDTFDFVNNLSRYKGKELFIYPDASGNSRKTSASDTDVKIIKNAGFRVLVDSSNPLIRDRINSVNGLLAHDRLLVNSDICIETASALETQGYDEKGEPEKWNTHPAPDDRVDSVGYFIAKRFGLLRGRTTKTENIYI